MFLEQICVGSAGDPRVLAFRDLFMLIFGLRFYPSYDNVEPKRELTSN